MPIRLLSPHPNYVPPKRECRHPEHSTPPLLGLKPGTWEWTCPNCGERHVFSVLDGEKVDSKS